MAAMTTLCQLFDASETANGCSIAAEQAEKTKEAEDRGRAHGCEGHKRKLKTRRRLRRRACCRRYG